MSAAVFPRAALIAAAALLAGLAGAPARAQMLLDVTGASAIQNSLQSLPSGAASGVIERSRAAAAQAGEADRQRNEALQRLGGSAAPGGRSGFVPMGMGTAGPAGLGPAAGTLGSARVNGRLVPYCSHGGLCYGSLLRAMGIR